MDVSFFLPMLTLFTLLAVAVFAYMSGVKADQRRKDPNAPKSTLATDGQPHGRPVDA